jgi:hypothetical protein
MVLMADVARNAATDFEINSAQIIVPLQIAHFLLIHVQSCHGAILHELSNFQICKTTNPQTPQA